MNVRRGVGFNVAELDAAALHYTFARPGRIYQNRPFLFFIVPYVCSRFSDVHPCITRHLGR